MFSIYVVNCEIAVQDDFVNELNFESLEVMVEAFDLTEAFELATYSPTRGESSRDVLTEDKSLILLYLSKFFNYIESFRN